MNTIDKLGEEETFRLIVERNITEYEDDELTSIGKHAFSYCSSLTRVSIPHATSIGASAFSNCSNLTSVSFPVATIIDSNVFESCSSLTSVSFPHATSIGYSAFNGCSSLTDVSIPVATKILSRGFASCSNLTNIEFKYVEEVADSAFWYCRNLTSISLPSVKKIYNNAFNGCSKLTTMYIGTESDTVCTLSGTTAIPSNVTDIYVPYSLIDSYKSATNWSSFAKKIKAYEQPYECVSLSITADDVPYGNSTTTKVHYTAECTYTKGDVLQEGTMVLTGTATSDPFEQNTSYTETVQRTVSFTFLGQTATTTITQGVYVDNFIAVETSGISSYGWVIANDTYNVDGYDAYMSDSKGKGSSQAVMKLTCIGYSELTLYIRSNAEGSYDYTIASKANVSNYPTSSDSADTLSHTKSKQNSGTTLSSYTAVNYTGLTGNDTIYIVFVKDSSGDNGDDRGFVLIPQE